LVVVAAACQPHIHAWHIIAAPVDTNRSRPNNRLPKEGSPKEETCHNHYPLALDTATENHPSNFKIGSSRVVAVKPKKKKRKEARIGKEGPVETRLPSVTQGRRGGR